MNRRAQKPSGDPDAALLARVHDTIERYHALGNQVVERDGIRIVRCLEAPEVWVANFACRVRAATDDAAGAVLATLDRELAHVSHRRVLIDPATPPAFQARLVVEDYVADEEVQLLLVGELRLDGARRETGIEIRLVATDADWESLATLARLDHEGEARRSGYEVWPIGVSRQIVGRWRAKCPPMRFWLAHTGGADVAYFGSWPGHDGIGLVDDLFTAPDFRGRGIATGLIARAIADARERGAGPVLIGARPDDTPKKMYAALGFASCCVTRTYSKHP